MKVIAAVVAALLFTVAPPTSPLITEPKTGASFATKVGDMTLLGVGLRTKTFLKIKVYALGLYVADSALSGPLAQHKGKLGSAAFFRELVVGDFEKQVTLKLARDLSADQIRGTFRAHMPPTDPGLREQFVSYFGATKAGGECVLRWVPGRGLETTVGGIAKPLIADKTFADAVFAIWLRDRPGEGPLRKQLVSRAKDLIQ